MTADQGRLAEGRRQQWPDELEECGRVTLFGGARRPAVELAAADEIGPPHALPEKPLVPHDLGVDQLALAQYAVDGWDFFHAGLLASRRMAGQAACRRFELPARGRTAGPWPGFGFWPTFGGLAPALRSRIRVRPTTCRIACAVCCAASSEVTAWIGCSRSR